MQYLRKIPLCFTSLRFHLMTSNTLSLWYNDTLYSVITLQAQQRYISSEFMEKGGRGSHWRRLFRRMKLKKLKHVKFSEHFRKSGCSIRDASTENEMKYLPVVLEGSARTDTVTTATAATCDKTVSRSCQMSIEDEAGSMKLCLQYFQSVRQLRISLYSVKELNVNTRRLITKVSLLGSKGEKKKQCSSKKTDTKLYSAVFNENIYLKLRAEDFSKFQLLIRLCRSRKGFRKSIPIGGVLLPLDGLNLDMDTAFEVKLTSPEQERKVLNRGDMKISRSVTIEELLRKRAAESKSDCTRASFRPRSTSAIRRLPAFIQYGANAV